MFYNLYKISACDTPNVMGAYCNNLSSDVKLNKNVLGGQTYGRNVQKKY